MSDLDGTLLDSRQKISKENQEAIMEFQKLGGIFTIATGRMEQSVKPYIDLLNIETPVILYNGAVVYDPRSGKRLMEKFLDNYRQLIDLFQKLASKVEVGVLVYQKENVYTIEKSPIIHEYEKKDRVECLLVSDAVLMKPITKILLISYQKEVLDKCEEILTTLNYPCELVYSESTYLEILPKTASKGAALKLLQHYLSNEGNLQTICVGDNLNDISMLELATKGFIVENCHNRLKGYNLKRTVHHEKHAIADIIYNHIFNSLAFNESAN